ncbi:hypothetical protein K2F54_17585, partial [Cryobacterium sp. 1639]|uniref:phosphopantetheine-binding protein n=1 Tax=Cryobacterium inferilacus TaxID=2866629 RepID=UPI001C72F32C
EVEAAIRATGLARDVVVIGHRGAPDAPLALAAYLVTDTDTDTDTDAGAEVRDALADRLPGYMIPASFTRIDAIPLTRNGKLDPAALPRPSPGKTVSAPLGRGLETEIAAVWTEVLGRDDIGPDDNFFEIGGTSLTLIQLRSQLATHSAEPLGIGDLFAATTVRAQAARIRRTAQATLVLRRTVLNRGGGGSTSTVAVSSRWEPKDTVASAYAFVLALESTTDDMPRQVLLWLAAGLVALDVPAAGPHETRINALERALLDARTLDVGSRIRFEGAGSLPALRLPPAGGAPDPVLLDEIDIFLVLETTAGVTNARVDGSRGRPPRASGLLRRFALLLDRLAGARTILPAGAPQTTETTPAGGE